jgi:hypothetical protein
MLKTIDVGLMSNHLLAHKGIIKRLEFYANSAKDQQLILFLDQQIGTMRNHVKVMNQLLDPNNTNPVTLPPIPQGLVNNGKQISTVDIGLEDHDMALDAHFTATAIANDNFISSSNMKNQQVKRIHTEMALQQSQIANQYEMLAQQLGWLKHPNATTLEQTEAMNVPTYESMTNQPHNQKQQRFQQ